MKLNAELLKTCRQSVGLSQRDLAKIAGISNAYVALHETGQRRISEKNHKQYMKAMNLTDADLIRARNFIAIKEKYGM